MASTEAGAAAKPGAAARIRTAVLVLALVGVGAFGLTRSDGSEPAVHELRDATPVPAETVEGAGGQLLAVKQWTPERDLVLICENYDEMLPMRPADLWVETDVPASGRVLVVVSAQTANSEPDKYDHWGLIIGGELVAQGRVGFGDTEHRVTARFVVDGLEGERVRIDVAHRSDRGGTANLFLGPSYGPATIEVWSA